mmetsp:Transcript_40757/g.118050  ORF Transcript_40757/g.118050 Transcript_40757/m.118050 type:complete len:288 (-) Transcript_40757:259-1122(-)
MQSAHLAPPMDGSAGDKTEHISIAGHVVQPNAPVSLRRSCGVAWRRSSEKEVAQATASPPPQPTQPITPFFDDDSDDENWSGSDEGPSPCTMRTSYARVPTSRCPRRGAAESLQNATASSMCSGGEGRPAQGTSVLEPSDVPDCTVHHVGHVPTGQVTHRGEGPYATGSPVVKLSGKRSARIPSLLLIDPAAFERLQFEGGPPSPAAKLRRKPHDSGASTTCSSGPTRTQSEGAGTMKRSCSGKEGARRGSAPTSAGPFVARKTRGKQLGDLGGRVFNIFATQSVRA